MYILVHVVRCSRHTVQRNLAVVPTERQPAVGWRAEVMHDTVVYYHNDSSFQFGLSGVVEDDNRSFEGTAAPHDSS